MVLKSKFKSKQFLFSNFCQIPKYATDKSCFPLNNYFIKIETNKKLKPPLVAVPATYRD